MDTAKKGITAMSRKTELLNQLQSFKTAYDTLEKNIREKRESGLYTEIGIEREINRLLSEISVFCAEYARSDD